LLDNVIPFSSVILLGVVVAVEDRFGIVVTREQLARACGGGSSLRKLAHMIEAQQEGRLDRAASPAEARQPEHSSP
jgi:acyl carrier protein